MVHKTTGQIVWNTEYLDAVRAQNESIRYAEDKEEVDVWNTEYLDAVRAQNAFIRYAEDKEEVDVWNTE